MGGGGEGEMENGTKWGKGRREGEKKEGRGQEGDTPCFFLTPPDMKF